MKTKDFNKKKKKVSNLTGSRKFLQKKGRERAKKNGKAFRTKKIGTKWRLVEVADSKRRKQQMVVSGKKGKKYTDAEIKKMYQRLKKQGKTKDSFADYKKHVKRYSLQFNTKRKSSSYSITILTDLPIEFRVQEIARMLNKGTKFDIDEMTDLALMLDDAINELPKGSNHHRKAVRTLEKLEKMEPTPSGAAYGMEFSVDIMDKGELEKLKKIIKSKDLQIWNIEGGIVSIDTRHLGDDEYEKVGESIKKLISARYGKKVKVYEGFDEAGLSLVNVDFSPVYPDEEYIGEFSAIESEHKKWNTKKVKDFYEVIQTNIEMLRKDGGPRALDRALELEKASSYLRSTLLDRGIIKPVPGVDFDPSYDSEFTVTKGKFMDKKSKGRWMEYSDAKHQKKKLDKDTIIELYYGTNRGGDVIVWKRIKGSGLEEFIEDDRKSDDGLFYESDTRSFMDWENAKYDYKDMTSSKKAIDKQIEEEWGSKGAMMAELEREFGK